MDVKDIITLLNNGYTKEEIEAFNNGASEPEETSAAVPASVQDPAPVQSPEPEEEPNEVEALKAELEALRQQMQNNNVRHPEPAAPAQHIKSDIDIMNDILDRNY